MTLPTGRYMRVGLCAVLLTASGIYVHDTTTARASVGNPLATLSHESNDGEALFGRVQQRLPAGSYCYLGLQTAGREALSWAVTLGKGQPVGTEVRVRTLGRKNDFYSPRLARTFAELRFAIVTRVD